MFYNVRKKVYADGTEQYMYFENAKEKGFTLDKERKKTGKTIERKKVDNMKRAVQIVYDIARSNIWDWFITLTFNPELVNSFVYEECAEALKGFTAIMQRKDFVYLLVPEQHMSGAYHFHGLVKGKLPVVPAKNPEGKLIVDGKGRQVYNISIYNLGFTTATAIDDQAKVAGYVAKYLTKEISVPKGKKRYWASKSAKRPEVEYLQLYSYEFGVLFNEADYQRDIDSPYGHFILCERRAEADVRVNKIKILFTREEGFGLK